MKIIRILNIATAVISIFGAVAIPIKLYINIQKCPKDTLANVLVSIVSVLYCILLFLGAVDSIKRDRKINE